MSDLVKKYEDSLQDDGGHLAINPAGHLVKLRPGSLCPEWTSQGIVIRGLKPGWKLGAKAEPKSKPKAPARAPAKPATKPKP